MVYFARKGNNVIHHTDINAMREWDGLKPETQLTEVEFLAYDNQVRLIDGNIFFGKTPKEQADQQARDRINEIDQQLKSIDAQSAGRSLRAAILAIKDDLPPSVAVDVQKLEALETQAQELRAERAALVASLELPY
jgi:chaperonin cofactor prefoldin